MWRENEREEAGSVLTTEPDDAAADRRRALRRKLPFGRGAVLEVDGREHIVGLVDVSVSGAYVSTRARIAAGAALCLRLLLLPDRRELRLLCEVVRVRQKELESHEHPRGVALRFLEMDDATRRRLKGFVSRAPLGDLR